LETALQTPDARQRAEALDTLVDRLPENLREVALRACLEAAQTIDWLRERIDALAARTVGDAVSARVARQLLAPFLPEGRRGPAIRAALDDLRKELPDTLRAVPRVLPHADGDQKDDALCRAFESLWRAEQDAEFAGLAGRFAGTMGERPARYLLAHTHLIPALWGARALLALARGRAGEHRDEDVGEALRLADHASRPDERIEILAALLPQLEGSIHQEKLDAALQCFREIDDRETWTHAGTELLPALTEPLKGEVARTVLPLLSGEAPSLSAALGSNRFADLSSTIAVLAAVAPELPEGQRQNLLAEVLRGLQPVQPLPEPLGRPGNDACFVVPAARNLANAVDPLARHLNEAQRQDALATAHKLPVAEAQAGALAGLLPHLSGSERNQTLREVLDACPKVVDPDLRRGILLQAFAACVGTGTAAVTLTPELARQTCLSVAAESDSQRRSGHLEWLAPHLARLRADLLHPIWCDCLRGLSRRGRPHLLRDLAALTPIMAALGGLECVERVCAVIEELGGWWP
jgi:hypothetical protein